MDRGSQLDEDDKEERTRRRGLGGGGGGGRRQAEEGRTQDAGRTQEATDIKSNNPHLAGGESDYDKLEWYTIIHSSMGI